MTIHPLAGKSPPKDLLVDPGNLRRQYYARRPDFADRAQRVGFRHQRSSGFITAWLVQ